MDEKKNPLNDKDVQDNKIMAALSYIWIVSVLMLLMKKDSPFVQQHARQGFVLFVPGVKEGEEVHIKVTKVLRNVGFAEVMGKATGAVGATPKPEPQEPQDTENFGEDSQESDDSGDLEQ